MISQVFTTGFFLHQKNVYANFTIFKRHVSILHIVIIGLYHKFRLAGLGLIFADTVTYYQVTVLCNLFIQTLSEGYCHL